MLTLYKLKDAARRASALFGAATLLSGVVAASIPAAVFADTLNPLTERSLTLSSSSPGWSYLDGSGNATYAYPNSGANGQKTGNTFDFRVSSNATIKAITFQYCTTPAGDCTAPGDNAHEEGTGTITLVSGQPTVSGSGTSFDTELKVGGTISVTGSNNVYHILTIDTPTQLTLTANASASESGTFNYRNVDSASSSDLNAVTSSPLYISNANWTAVQADADKTPARNNTQGNFVVLTGAAAAHAGASTYNAGVVDWTMASSNDETYNLSQYIPPINPDPEMHVSTGRNNMITISSATGIPLTFNPTDGGDYVKVIFYGTDTNYITNPGSGAFFVRMNTYSDAAATTVVDGGVTVANVMNESITIQTKVLETMDFSVGTYDPDLYTRAQLATIGRTAHGQCESLLMANPTAAGVTDQASYEAQPHNVLHLGDPTAEYSLATNKAYAVQSYFRLSSNSSGGATIYYTGHTLTNTENDEIKPMPSTATQSIKGTEQFGLGLAYDTDNTLLGGSTETYPVWEGDSTLYDSYGTLDADGGTGDGDFASFLYDGYIGNPAPYNTLAGNDAYAHYPRLYPLAPLAPYNGNAAGDITTSTPKFAFNANADTYAQPLASENTDVVNCITAKIRYIANIAATTPAGLYTTKINYVASPQY